MRRSMGLVFVTILLLAGWGSPLQAQLAGNIDGITGSTGSQYIQGWACSVGDDDPISVKLFTNGTAGAGQFYAGYTANASITNDPAVETTCGNNDPHMFKIPISGDLYAFAGQSIYVDVYSEDTGAYTDLTGSGSFTVPATSTIGYIDGLDSSGKLTGWACDTSSPSTNISVNIYVGGHSAANFGNGLRGAENGTYLTTVQTDVSRPDVQRCPSGTGITHGFSVTLSSSVLDGVQYVSVYAVPASSGAATGAFLPPSSSNASNVPGGKTMSLSATFTTQDGGNPTLITGFNLPSDNFSVVALSGTVQVYNAPGTGQTNIYSEMLFGVTYLPSNLPPSCPTSGTTDYTTAPLGSSLVWHDILKTPFAGTVTTPVNFTLPAGLPNTLPELGGNSISNCLLLVINGGQLPPAHDVTGTANLVVTYLEAPSSAVTESSAGEYCFGQDHGCSLATTDDTQSFASVTQITSASLNNSSSGTLDAILGNISDSTFDGSTNHGPLPTGAWSTVNEIYLYPASDCSSAFPSGTGHYGPGDYVGSEPSDATLLVSAPLAGSGMATGQTINYLLSGETDGTNVYYDFTTLPSSITVNAGDCLVEFYGVNTADGAFDDEDQLLGIVMPQ